MSEQVTAAEPAVRDSIQLRVKPEELQLFNWVVTYLGFGSVSAFVRSAAVEKARRLAKELGVDPAQSD
jgi:uncharacterized protein (DUF1778 family)